MTELLDGLLQASLWLAAGVALLAVLRPLLVRMGGAGLAYRSWWLLPLLLVALLLPLPQAALLQHVPALPLKVLPGASDSVDGQSLPGAWLLLMAWALGMGICLLRDLRAQRRFERNMGPLKPRADGSWQASGDPGLPALVGLWRPRIVVGPDFDQQFTVQEQGLILQHERSHQRNGDHWANGALLLIRAVFWFHPLLSWAARCFLRDQELACDARTMAPQPSLRGLYASTLLKAQLVHPVAPAVCHWRSQPVLKERIAMLKQSRRKALPWVSGQVLVVGVCVGMGAVAWASQGSTMAGSPAAAVVDREIQVDKMPPPSYPKSAIEQRQVGVVNLRVEVDAQGHPSDVRVLSASNPGVFDAVSIAAARSWTYRPAMKNGKPVAGAVKIPINYAMDDTEDTK
ncbi:MULTISPECIES: TonB family protein [Stenotrophomonas]|uniref:Peptidase n=1 Tax=Stenotrophomonas maltophilia TaxID=40324 RepID=A0A2J0UDJ5_STEMA|nr:MULTISPECIES: TonB family protein [Stenotrophomonas]PJL31516.1 peptidase [Stenotrophomonas maltophilia]HDS1147300.1 TonB family protein [Stenotrophomonas maltophilia]HDS1161534.1 TonB family protein [Stenotrophomonas maltophilia]